MRFNDLAVTRVVPSRFLVGLSSPYVLYVCRAICRSCGMLGRLSLWSSQKSASAIFVEIETGLTTDLSPLMHSSLSRILLQTEFVLFFHRAPAQRHFLICFFIAYPSSLRSLPLSLSFSLAICRHCKDAARVDRYQMFRVSDLSPSALSFSLSVSK